MFRDDSTEGGDDDRSGDASVGGDRQGVAGMDVEPGEDFDVLAVGEAVVGEVDLPGLIRLLGGEADVGGLRALRVFSEGAVTARRTGSCR